jgi:hypothetical protein
MIEIQITNAALAAAMTMPSTPLDIAGYTRIDEATGDGDYRVASRPETGTLVQWQGGPEIATEAGLLAILAGAPWLAYRKRALIAALDAERLPRLEAAGWTPAAREDAIAGIPSAGYQAHHIAERQAVALAYHAAAEAVRAAADLAAAEAAAAAVQWPTLVGPEGAV